MYLSLLGYLFLMDASVWIVVYTGLRFTGHAHARAMLYAALIMALAAFASACYVVYVLH